MTRSNHASSFAGAPIKEDRTSPVAGSATAVARAGKVGSETAAVLVVDLEIGVAQVNSVVAGPASQIAPVRAAWAVARETAAAPFKASIAAAVRRAPPARVAAPAGEALVVAEEREPAAAPVAVAAAGDGDKLSTRF
jgi:hypothetical protein